MPYSSLKELPEAVQAHLPKHAQEIYKEAFNNAQMHYVDPDKRKGEETPEEIAHKVAWHAVKQVYEKDDNDNWTLKDS